MGDLGRNDILRRLRYALNMGNSEMAGVFKLGGYELSEYTILSFLKREEEEGFVECSDRELGFFLDGLIVRERGERETPGNAPGVEPETRISNNLILKTLRIALNFKEGDMLEMFRLAGFGITKSELSALFRKKGHKNYRACGDQILKNFIQGLTLYLRR